MLALSIGPIIFCKESEMLELSLNNQAAAKCGFMIIDKFN